MRRALAFAAMAAAAALLACAPRVEPASRAPARASDATQEGAFPAEKPPIPTNLASILTIEFLDVGQGDAALLTTSDHHAMLVDSGPEAAASRVAGEIGARATALDAVVLSHAHADHLGALSSLARNVPIARWLDPAFAEHPVAEYPRALAVLRARGVPITAARRGDRFTLGPSVDVTVLAPREPLLHGTRSDVNASSVVLRVDHHTPRGDDRVLFEGDAEEPTERRLLEDPASLRADVLKVAHHGSRYASSDALLAAVSPRLAVISCGTPATGNDYGHPHAQTLRRLEAHGAAIARTDLEGDVTVTSSPDALTWTVARPAAPEAIRQPGVPPARAAEPP